MTLRRKFIVYLFVIHLFFGTIAILFLNDQREWLFAVEAVFVLSFWLGYRLVHSLFIPLDLIRTGAELIDERDFGSRFLEVGQVEMDKLIGVYNEMIDTLREERLRTEEKDRLLERIIESSPSAIITCNFDGFVENVNSSAEEFLGMTRSELEGRPSSEFDHPILETLARLERGESRVISVHGRRRFRVRESEFLDRGFTKRFYLIDELTDELRASEKAAYGKLIRMMSHEVNNSTGAVRSLLESSLNYRDQLREDDREDFRNALEVAIGRLENLDRFVGGFADVVRLPDPKVVPVSVQNLVTDVVTLMKPDLESRRIGCEASLDSEIEPVDLDKNQIEQVLINAVKNAMESIGNDGPIQIILERNGGGSALIVRDTGPGISPEIESHLFTPFTSTKKDGRGLGLTIIGEILTQHGFDFSLGNHPEGGAEFRIGF